MRKRRELPLLWRPLPLLLLWIVAGAVLSGATGRVRDWFDMTDELRYERLAISIARTHSLVPRIHGVDVQSFSQLYPLLIAPIFAHGLVPADVVDAHVFNAWLMSSTCVPAYLLARRVTSRRLWAYLVAVLSVCMPWILYSTMLMTEVAAYPASAWALLALYWAVVRPSILGDLVALLGLALAFMGRTELIVLVFVPPPAILAFEVGRAEGRGGAARLAAGARSAVSRHRLLTAAYVGLLVAGLVANYEGDLAGVFGVYGAYAHQNTLFPAGIVGSYATHVAVLALGFGLLPLLVGGAWLLANIVRPAVSRERHAFACVAGTAALGILFQATNFDVRYTGYVHDRFLLYLVPLVLIAMFCALDDERRPRWSILVPALALVCGFATGSFPRFTWQQFPTLTPDSPMSSLLRPIVALTHTLGVAQAVLAVASAALAGLFLVGSQRLDRRHVTAGTTAFTLVVMPVITIATFAHFFGAVGWSSRPVTQSEAGAYDWIDQAIGTTARVTAVPYPISSDWFVSQQRWRDIEFWNKSVIRDALQPGGDVYAYTGIWFPKLALRFNPTTGAANISPTPWVVVSDKDTRFAIVGHALERVGDVLLIKAGRPWRASWISFGLYDDGWTKPGVTARIRIFPDRGQRTPLLRTFVFAVHPAAQVSSQPVSVVSDVDSWHGQATNTGTVAASVKVCVPARGYTQIRLSTPISTTIPGDQASQVQSVGTRRGGVFFGETALASEIDGRCRV